MFRHGGVVSSYFCFEVKGCFGTVVSFLSYFCPEAKGCFGTVVSFICAFVPKRRECFDTAVSFLRTFVPKQKYQKFSAQKERWLDANIGKNRSLGKSALTSLLRRGGLPLTFGVVRIYLQFASVGV